VIDSLTGQGINIEHACRTLNVSVSGYYAWKDRPDPPRRLRRIWLSSEIVDVHKASGGTYGVRRVTAELTFGREVVVSRSTVESIMHELGIRGVPNRRLPKGARLAQVTSLDLVRRRFARDRPNELWLTDITEHPTNEGKVYCCVVLDTFSRLVVGWAVDSRQATVLVLNALGMATQRRENRDGLIVHSDRGTQPMWPAERPICCCSRIARAAAWQPSQVPVRSTAISSSNLDTGVASIGASTVKPALFTQISIRPKVLTAARLSTSMSSADATSALWKLARPPAATICSWVGRLSAPLKTVGASFRPQVRAHDGSPRSRKR
jgi:transposase